jgi:hypothetical protein
LHKNAQKRLKNRKKKRTVLHLSTKLNNRLAECSCEKKKKKWQKIAILGTFFGFFSVKTMSGRVFFMKTGKKMGSG